MGYANGLRHCLPVADLHGMADCQQLFILSPDIDIFPQETLPWQLFHKVRLSPPRRVYERVAK